MIKFLEEFIKEQIIREFEDFMLLSEDVKLHFLRGIVGEPILTLCDIWESSTEYKRFALCNVAGYDLNSKKTHIYAISGMLTTLNGGRIRIVDYTSKKYI